MPNSKPKITSDVPLESMEVAYGKLKEKLQNFYSAAWNRQRDIQEFKEKYQNDTSQALQNYFDELSFELELLLCLNTCYTTRPERGLLRQFMAVILNSEELERRAKELRKEQKDP